MITTEYTTSDKTLNGKQLYICDREKNKTCYAVTKGLGCEECKLTTKKTAAKLDDNGNPIKAKFLDEDNIKNVYLDLMAKLHEHGDIVKIVTKVYLEGDTDGDELL